METTPTPATAEFADMLSLRQVGVMCGVSVWTVRRWMEDGVLEGHRVPGTRPWKIRRQDVTDFLAGAERKGGRVRKPRGPVDSDTALSSVGNTGELSVSDQINLDELAEGYEQHAAPADAEHAGLADQIVLGPVG
jgi:excisionase family DNA binding protein